LTAQEKWGDENLEKLKIPEELPKQWKTLLKNIR